MTEIFHCRTGKCHKGRCTANYESTLGAHLTQSGGRRNRVGFWAEVGSKISCDLGEVMEHSKEKQVFKNKEAGLYVGRINCHDWFRLADVWAVSRAVGDGKAGQVGRAS